MSGPLYSFKWRGLFYSESEVMKSRRPMTANTRLSSTSNNNSQNPTSKVHPWTQRSGQGMSLSERRSKLQKSVSIHSLDSFDFGDGEGSDFETESSFSTTMSSRNDITPVNIPGPNSSAYKETRKSLFFHPPPEISTMISLVSPIETLEIQYEIEKVAVMLKNMQNQNKSFIDLCPADCSLSTSPLCKGDKTVRNTQKDNEFAKDRGDINGNPTAANTTGCGDKAIISEGQGTCGLSLESVGETNIVENAACGKPKNGPNGKELPSGIDMESGTAMDSNLSNRLHCNLVPSLAEDIRESISIKDVNPIDMEPCISDPNSLKVQTLPTLPIISPSATGARRPPLKKSVSISCEKELLQTPGYQNEVNGNGNFLQPNGNKGSRPKTAAISTISTSRPGANSKPYLLSRSSSTSTIPLTSSSLSSNSHRTRPNVSNSNQSPSHMIKTEKPSLTGNTNQNSRVGSISMGTSPTTTSVGESNQSQSQALRNRKILIKKALIEINQSSSHLGKKWGILGRPKTAPSPGASNNNKKSVTSTNAMMSCGQNQKRQPLKASPPQPPISGVKPGQPMGKGVTPNQKLDSKGENNGLRDEQIESETDIMGDSVPTSGNNRRTLHRQSFSLDEGLLLGFSNKEFGWNSADGTCDDLSKGREEVSVLSSKKREECLKIYEKMMKTGFAVKLDTIFRGMMTPSEYRAFIKAAETAARDAADAAAAAAEEGEGSIDAGVNAVNSVTSDVKEVSLT